jgi:hypothetical protein
MTMCPHVAHGCTLAISPRFPSALWPTPYGSLPAVGADTQILTPDFEERLVKLRLRVRLVIAVRTESCPHSFRACARPSASTRHKRLKKPPAEARAPLAISRSIVSGYDPARQTTVNTSEA